MSEELKRQMVRTKNGARRVRVTSVLKQFQCEHVSYEFDVPMETFDAKLFFKTTGIEADSWSAVLNPRKPGTGYHAHFSGNIEDGTAHLAVEYWDKGRPLPNDAEPFSESIMRWLGSFITVPSLRAFAVARFKKPKDKWRSRFNLPFRVTMVEAEVVIDGVSLVLPKNPHQAVNAFLTVDDKGFTASVQATRSIEFDKFNIRKEIAALNEAVKMFMEPVA